jgi:hypothetical protein
LLVWANTVDIGAGSGGGKAKGELTLKSRRGATDEELRKSRHDVIAGMFFSNLIIWSNREVTRGYRNVRNLEVTDDPRSHDRMSLRIVEAP